MPEDTNNNPHQIVLYLDLAIKNYCDKRKATIKALGFSDDKQKFINAGTDCYYVAPVKNYLAKELKP